MAETKNSLGDQPEKDPRLEAALANRMIGRGETFNDELLATASTPQEVFIALRAIEKKLDDGNIPSSLSENYRPPGQLSIMFNRAEQLRETNKNLEAKKWILNYNPLTGEAIPAKRIFAGFAISTEETPEFDVEGKLQIGILGEPIFRITHNFGTEEKRAELARAYERAITEMEARSILGEWVGVMLNLGARDDLNALVNFEHTTTAKFKADHLRALFNMPDVGEMATTPENHTLGDQVEEAIFLNLVMLNSGNKQRMLDFLARPGVQHLINKLHKEEQARKNDESYSRVDWIEDNIGKVNSWVDDNSRDLEKTWKEEARDGRRGRLTKWGNIAAFGGNPGDMGGDDEKEFIENTVGGLVGSVEASWIGASFLRAFGTYAAEGYVALPDGKSILPLGESRYISSDDRGKFWTYMFNIKEGTRGRKSGLKDMIGKIPDTAFDLFDWAHVVMGDLPLNSDGSQQRRSIWDAWLGTPGGKPKINLLTGEVTNILTQREDYHRLGDLNFDSLDRDFHGSFGIMQWLLGNEQGPTGVFVEALKTNVEYKDFLLDGLKAINKYIGIVMNPVILTKGSMHLYDNVGAYKTIQKNFLRNLMVARIKSYSYLTNVLNYTVPIFAPDVSEQGIPAPLLVREFVREVLKDNPKDESELIAHYVDEYERVTNLGEGPLGLKTSGNRADTIEAYNETYMPTNPKQVELAKHVGRVTGRKTI